MAVHSESVPSAGAVAARLTRLRRWLIPAALAVAAGVVFGVVVAASIHVPDIDALIEKRPSLVTQLFDREGRDFQTYFRQRRVMLEEGQVPKVIQDALIAAEDQNFFRHGGIDLQGLARTVIVNLTSDQRRQGASTLTMQLARNLFGSYERTWERKVREALVAVELEKRFSKQHILTLYCNWIQLPGANYGFEEAARDFFGKSAAELELHEAATLVGIVPRPSEWNTRRRPETALSRRNMVLGRMRAERYVTQAEHDAAVSQPLLLVPPTRQGQMGSYFSEEVRRHLYTRHGEKVVLDRGLLVHTTLDPAAQRAAEQALRGGLVLLDRRRGRAWGGPTQHLDGVAQEHIELPSWVGLELVPGNWFEGVVTAVLGTRARVRVGGAQHLLLPVGYEWTHKPLAALLRPGDVAWFELRPPAEGEREPRIELVQEPKVEGAVVLLESATGAVRALVGGFDYQRNEFNRATQAKRQVGSAFKPFVFGAALESGFTGADTLFDAPCVFPGADGRLTWSPRNFYRSYYGIVTLRKALEKSANVTAAKLQDLVGVERVIDFARRAGITADLAPYPSLALGVSDIIPIELAGAYATVANGGFFIEPYLIERVETLDGRVLERHQPRAQRAMEPQIAYLLTSMLEGVIDRGTAAKVADLDLDLAGKTGTTDSFTDAWFVGYSTTHTLVVWVGFDEKRTLGRNMTGAEAALPIWRDIVVRGLEADWFPRGRFTAPSGVVFREVDADTGLLATAASPHPIREAFLVGTEPDHEYETRWARILELPWYQQRPFYRAPRERERMPEAIADWSLVEQARAEEQ